MMDWSLIKFQNPLLKKLLPPFVLEQIEENIMDGNWPKHKKVKKARWKWTLFFAANPEELMRTTPTKKRNAVLDYILELLQTNTFKYHLSVKSMISILHSDWKLSKKSHFNISRQKWY